jgi:hypothetical protein
MKRSIAMTIITLLLSASLFALDEQPTIINPDEARQRAAQLRLEASAHQEMERQLAAQSGGSRRDRRWRKTMVGLCHDYSAAAMRAAEAYERVAAIESTSSRTELQQHTSLPVTAAEYDARAAEYEARAESLRADADRHLSMLRSSRERDLQQPYYGGNAGQRRRGGWLESPKERVAREHCEDVVQQNFELARDADDIAKHYRLRARQLEATR